MTRKKTYFLVFLILTFLFLDFSPFYFPFFSNLLKLSFVFFLCFFAKDTPFFLPLFFTFFCDYFLLFTTNYTLGLSLFTLVHLLYSNLWKQKRGGLFPTSNILFQYCLFFPLLICLPLPMVTLVYLTSFLYHISVSIQVHTPVCYLFGLFLFILCDGFTLLCFITKSSFFSNFIWLCYAPALLLMLFSNWLPLGQKFVLPLPKR